MIATKISIRQNLELGMAWLWIKSSFATFREKPINFLFFGLSYVLFAFIPIIGIMLTVLVSMRIYFNSSLIQQQQNIGLELNLVSLLRQRNIFSYLLFYMGIYFIILSSFSQLVNSYYGISEITPEILVANPQLLFILFSLSVAQAIFLGVTPLIICFNPQIRLWSALKINWCLLWQNLAVLILALFLLFAIILIPLYLVLNLLLLVNNGVLLGFGLMVLIILLLVSLVITNIFTYQVYQSGLHFSSWQTK
ncbi:MAG: hypothetical protein RLZZ293_1131 [Pseudomonadota bacterium]|jgi:hypothetical protein